jgi:hypothetical protein
MMADGLTKALTNDAFNQVLEQMTLSGMDGVLTNY